MAKMSNKMIALCSLAVGAVYTSGYIVTATDSHTAQASETKSTSPSTTHSNTTQHSNYRAHYRDRSFSWDGHHGDRHRSQQNNNPNNSSGSSGSSTGTTTQQPSQGTTQTKYKDGTYTGVGTNEIGSVQVAVKITQGKIASVTITNCTTSYSESNIEPLPAEVVSRQSANVDNVSGATRSTEDFQNAVEMALSKAKA